MLAGIVGSAMYTIRADVPVSRHTYVTFTLTTGNELYLATAHPKGLRTVKEVRNWWEEFHCKVTFPGSTDRSSPEPIVVSAVNATKNRISEVARFSAAKLNDCMKLMVLQQDKEVPF